MLGTAGLQVSPFCLGMVKSEETIGAAFDAGINFFFLSGDLHWPYYEASRRGLEKLLARGQGIREQVVVAVASYVTQPDLVPGPFAEVLEFVTGLDRIDVAIAGAAFASEFAPRAGRFRELRDYGAFGIAAVGMTFHQRRAALQAVNDGLVDIAFTRYSPLFLGARSELFPHLTDASPSLLYTFKSTLGATSLRPPSRPGPEDREWRPKVTDYYRFALSRPEIDGLLCALSTPREVEQLALAMEEGPLDASEEQLLIEVSTK